MEEEIATNSLTVPQLERSIPEIVNLLSALDTPINVEYGYACNLPIDELWQTMQMDLPHLQDFINKSREDRIFELGVSDLHVNDLEGRWSIKLCHESDLHFVRRCRDDVGPEWVHCHDQPLHDNSNTQRMANNGVPNREPRRFNELK
jgi:hypothetical protein